MQCVEHQLAGRNAQGDEAPRSREQHLSERSGDRSVDEQAAIRATGIVTAEAPPLLLRGGHSQAPEARIGAGADQWRSDRPTGSNH